MDVLTILLVVVVVFLVAVFVGMLLGILDNAERADARRRNRR